MQALHKQGYIEYALILCLTQRYSEHNLFPHFDASYASDILAKEMRTDPYTAVSYAPKTGGILMIG